MLIKTPSGYELGGLVSHPAGEGVTIEADTIFFQRFRFRCNLLPGTYFLNSGITSLRPGNGEEYLHRILDAAMFKVIPENRSIQSGIVDLCPLPQGSSDVEH